MSRSDTSENWKGYVYEHRYIAELQLGRKLAEDEEVHHLDGDPQNNRWENLLVLTKDMHAKLHIWLSAGAPYSEKVGMNWVNSGKAKSDGIRCITCGITLQQKQKLCCSQKCLEIHKDGVSKRPPKSQLDNDLASMSMLAIGRKYGVSDNAVRKWIRKYEKADMPILSQAGDTSSEGATTT
jgi:hypothetical protein